jgi:hypothetical protein
MGTNKLSAEEVINSWEILLSEQATSSVSDVIICELKHLDMSQLDMDQSIRLENIKREVGA